MTILDLFATVVVTDRPVMVAGKSVEVSTPESDLRFRRTSIDESAMMDTGLYFRFSLRTWIYKTAPFEMK